LLRAGPASAQADEQVLRVAVEGGRVGATGFTPGTDIDRSITPFVFMTPLLLTKDNELVPWLATAFEANADNTVFTVHLDPRAVWSDGQPVTAQDFKAWYDWVARPDQQSAVFLVLDSVQGFAAVADGTAETIEGIVAVDDQTLEFHLIRPEGLFAERLAIPQAAVGRLEQYQGQALESWIGENVSNLIVNGPFKPTALNPEPEGTYFWEQNPAWWGDTKPTITRIEGQTIRDFQTMLLLFQNEQIDMAFNLSGPPAVQLRAEQPEVFKLIPQGGFWAMYFDVTKEPVTDLNLRLALLHAIDWASLARVAWEGEQPPSDAGNLLSPGTPCRDDNYRPYPFDVTRAQEYLAQSSYGTGENVPKIRVSTAGSDPPRQRAAQIVQEFWRVNLGIEDVEIRNVEEEFGAEQELIAVITASGGGNNPAQVLQFTGHSRGLAAQEFTHLNVPELDEGIDAFLGMDPEDPAYCGEATRLITLLQDQAVVIPTAYIERYYQVQPWLKNAEVNQELTFYTLMDMRIER
jgi:ABC-type transport system substrate-binding protein